DTDLQAQSSTTMPVSSTSRFQLAISALSQPLASSSAVRRGTSIPPRAKAACISGTLIAATNALRSVSMMSAGTADGAKPAAHRGAHAGESDFGKRGNIRMLRKPLLGGNGERAHAARFDHSDGIGDVEPRHVDVAVGEIAEDLGTAALERNVHEIKTGAF